MKASEANRIANDTLRKQSPEITNKDRKNVRDKILKKAIKGEKCLRFDFNDSGDWRSIIKELTLEGYSCECNSPNNHIFITWWDSKGSSENKNEETLLPTHHEKKEQREHKRFLGLPWVGRMIGKKR
jgi:hypothetical protein